MTLCNSNANSSLLIVILHTEKKKNIYSPFFLI